jgi:hypothetical protein
VRQVFVQDAPDFFDGRRQVLTGMGSTHDEFRLNVIHVGTWVLDQAILTLAVIPTAFNRDD